MLCLNLNFQSVGMKYCRIMCLKNVKSLNHDVMSGLENNLSTKNKDKWKKKRYRIDALGDLLKQCSPI
jgi:hypothetical protein